MSNATRTTRFRLWLWLIRGIGVIVPRRLRAGWTQEWEAELCYREELLSDWDKLDWRNRLALLWHSAGAFMDALWMQPRRMEDEMFQDLRFGVRMLLRHKNFTAVAVLTLALGIGANTAVFSLLDALLFKALPVKDPQQLVFVQRVLSNNRTQSEIPDAAFEQLRDMNSSFTAMATYESAPVSMTAAEQPEVVWADFVSGGYFDALGITTIVGRTLTSEDCQPGGQPLATLSYGYWKRRFAQDPAIVGKTIYLGKVPVTVIGAMPPGFIGLRVEGRVSEVILPMSFRAQLALKDFDRFAIGRASGLRRVVARLKPGVGIEQARAELDSIYQRTLAQAASADRRGASPEKIGLRAGFRGDADLSQASALGLRILSAVVAAVLLIAAVNVAGLLLGRAVARRKEIAVRLALGASRQRLIRQLLTESLLLGLLGGALGLLLAKWSAGVLKNALIREIGNSNVGLTLDWRALAFTIALSLLTGVLFGLAPALVATRIDLNPILKSSGGESPARAPRLGLGKSLVVAQVALSLALLIGAGLMIRSLWRLYGVDTGFERDKVLTAMAYPGAIGYEREREIDLDRRLLERLNALPGVKSASLSLSPIYRGAVWVGPHYFETEGIGLLAGRGFSTADLESATKVSVISDGLARKFFPNENPVGQHFGFELGGGVNIRPRTGDIEIIGVAKDVRTNLWEQDRTGFFYLPFNQAPPRALGQVQFLIRAAGDPSTLVPAVRGAVQAIERDLALVNIKTQAEEMNEKYLGEARSITTLLSFFSALALGLAAIGLYGTMSYAVCGRIKEIGVRLALGAQRKNIFGMVLRETFRLVALGIVIGMPLAMAANRLISSLLFGVKTTDAVTTAGAILVMLMIAIIAGCVPARRATKVDPMIALRDE